MTITKQWLAATAALGIAVLGAVSMIDIAPGTRSVQPLSEAGPEPVEKFDPAQSAALFVGVREFDGNTQTVQYAVDDAVDLAHAFSFRSQLVKPERVVLALSGEPQKEESQVRLRRLLAAGARLASATAEELRSLVRQQAERVTPEGLLIVSFATHGFVDDDGTHYLLGRDSTFDARTSLSASHVLDVAWTVSRSLVLVDACRERVPMGSRAGDAGPRSSAPVIRRMSGRQGHVVLYAAAPGEYAYDDDENRNGVFTRAVLEALSCKGTTAKVVTVDVLQKYVNERVREWVQKKRRGKGGIQVSMTDDTRLMPLANCDCTPPPPSEGWRARLDLPVSRSEVANLDGDCTNEIVAQAAGAVYAFDADGRQLWSAGEAVREFFIGTAYDGERIVLALLPKGFLVVDHDGKVLARVLGHLQHVRLYRPSMRHMNRIVAMKDDTVLLFKSNKSVPEWHFDLPGRFESLDIRDYNNDRKLDLVLRTASGRVVLDVDGDPLDGVHVRNLRRK